jgi:hypothetical protein
MAIQATPQWRLWGQEPGILGKLAVGEFWRFLASFGGFSENWAVVLVEAGRSQVYNGLGLSSTS